MTKFNTEYRLQATEYRIQNTEYRIQNTVYRPPGFTLIELLIVIAITSVLSTLGIGYYANQQRTKSLETTAQEIASYLKYSQQKSISQEQGLQWGVHFENPSSGADFYALYTGTSYTTPIETKYLPAGLEFQTPTTGNSINISFSKLTGLNVGGSEQELIIRLTSNQVARVIRVTSAGLVTLNEGEKGYWKFDEGSGAIALDSTIYKNNGTLYNGPTWQSASNCVSGSCLSFDGSDDYVNCGNDGSLNITNAITIEAWVKFNSLTGSSSYQWIAGKSTGFAGLSKGSDNRLYFFTTDGNHYGYSSVLSWDTNRWYHLVGLTTDGTVAGVRFYRNGEYLPVTVIVEGSIISSTDPLAIGRWNGGNNHYFNGLIDEVRIYNRALSPAEIQQHYNSRS